MNPDDIIRHELIGLSAKISKATNNSLCGLKGIVIDESRNTITLADGKRRIVVPKDVATFRLTLKDETLVQVDGSRLVGRPESRLKTKVRRW